MKEQKTTKVLDVWDRGIHVTCIKDFRDQLTPYHLYLNWWDNGRTHKKLLMKYNHIINALHGTQNVFINALNK